jgi:hypothetical protein
MLKEELYLRIFSGPSLYNYKELGKWQTNVKLKFSGAERATLQAGLVWVGSGRMVLCFGLDWFLLLHGASNAVMVCFRCWQPTGSSDLSFC